VSHFTGKERDSKSGLDNFGARYDSSSIGRFMSPDPSMDSARLRNPQSWNRYAYTIDNPLSYVDPDGELWIASGNNANPIRGSIRVVRTKRAMSRSLQTLAGMFEFTAPPTPKTSQTTQPINTE